MADSRDQQQIAIDYRYARDVHHADAMRRFGGTYFKLTHAVANGSDIASFRSPGDVRSGLGPDLGSLVGRSLNLMTRIDDHDLHSLNGVIQDPFEIQILLARLDIACPIRSPHAELVLARLCRIPDIAP